MLSTKRYNVHSIIEELSSQEFLRYIDYEIPIIQMLDWDLLDNYTVDNVEFPINLPAIEIEITNSKDLLLTNAEFNDYLMKNSFSYLLWRNYYNFNKLNLRPSNQTLSYYNPNIKITSDRFRYYESSNHIDILNIITDTLEHNVFYIPNKVDGYRCLFFPLENKSFIFIGDKNSPYHFFYLLHELGHVIVNYLVIKLSLYFSIEEEEYWAHMFESSLINSFFPEEKRNYQGFLHGLLEENKATTFFQILLFKLPKQYISLESKMKLYEEIMIFYNITTKELIDTTLIFDFLDHPFYSAAYINGQADSLKNIGIYSLNEMILLFNKTFSN